MSVENPPPPTAPPPPPGGNPWTPLFMSVVNAAADQVQAERNVTFTPQARQVLIDRAVAHVDDVAAVLKSPAEGRDQLLTAAVAQFREAAPHQGPPFAPLEDLPGGPLAAGFGREANFVGGFGRPPRRVIDHAAVDQAMDRKCHFVPWC